ncbi:LytR C-terminal domain-containing protein [Actinocrispum wychmicini]|uniref:LytR cell envelope-related transcriptional attenuator n=1 Tax=Actinocrispum wychmicini TaxID=1213861 RepID=A0A4R2JHB4_9PSEU|nr:LytR C-terminal domain-containing protein [Actinocrispum wychmicini]TCO58077.1 LytR cell envelope-related transcriptional attenuator [Actinocrispum wychmicini]
MTSPEGAGPTRPGRLAGLALLAVAAIALVVGLISVFGGGGSDQPTNNTAGTPAAGTPSQEPPSSPGSPPPSSATPPSSETPPSSPPPSSSSSTPSSEAPPSPPPDTTPGHVQPVQVLNNSKITGLADRAATDFRNRGWNVTAVDNLSETQAKVPFTTVYYRPGTAEEAEARDLANQFGLHVDRRIEGLRNFGPGLIVVVAKEYNPKN